MSTSSESGMEEHITWDLNILQNKGKNIHGNETPFVKVFQSLNNKTSINLNDSSNIVALSEELPIPQGIRVYPSISGAGSDSSILGFTA